jgi:hypothetical protein
MARRVRTGRWQHVGPAFLLTVACVGLAAVALVDLAVRSAIRWDPQWDGLAYHIPFAAVRGGLSIPYDMNDAMRPRFDGFPPLPELVQGLFWRATGSVNATGVVNFLAFGIFLAYCHKALRAPFWLVALISLTAPLVLIHTSTVYVDLFGNAFLAIGLASCLALYLFPEQRPRLVTLGGLAALTAAAWSKYQLVPLVGVAFLLFIVVVFRSRAAEAFSRRQAAAILLVFVALAAAPYAKNLAVFGNPFWPVRVPVAGALFPYVEDSTAELSQERPADLIGAPQAEVFVLSLLETRNQAHWTFDQRNGEADRRMGGFWSVGVIVYLLLAFGMLISHRRREGLIAALTGLGLLALVAFLPQSNELRYYMFLPLTWAATIAMLFPAFRGRFPRAGVALLVVALGLFGFMAWENGDYYSLKKLDYQDNATTLGVAAWWSQLQPGQTYCAVGIFPTAILMTGPTMHEFTIIDRSRVSLCPAGTIVATPAGLQGPYQPN